MRRVNEAHSSRVRAYSAKETILFRNPIMSLVKPSWEVPLATKDYDARCEVTSEPEVLAKVLWTTVKMPDRERPESVGLDTCADAPTRKNLACNR